MTDVALFSNASTILLLLEINDNGYMQCCWNPRLNKDFLFCKLILRVDEKAMIRKSNSTSFPRHQSGKEQKDEQYQLELLTIETLPWNDQYRINGRGLKPVYTILPLRIYTDRTFMQRDFSLHIALLFVTKIPLRKVGLSLILTVSKLLLAILVL